MSFSLLLAGVAFLRISASMFLISFSLAWLHLLQSVLLSRSHGGQLTPKPALSTKCSLQLACMKPETLIIASTIDSLTSFGICRLIFGINFLVDIKPPQLSLVSHSNLQDILSPLTSSFSSSTMMASSLICTHLTYSLRSFPLWPYQKVNTQQMAMKNGWSFPTHRLILLTGMEKKKN